MNFNLLPGQQAEVLVFDILGKHGVKTSTFWRKWQIIFQVTDLKAGLYFANIMLNGQLHEMKRLIVSK